MRLRSISLLLLLALALRLGAGPHPCQARPMPAAPAEHASCHGMPAPAQEKGKDDCCDPRTGDHSLCEQGCQRAAVLLVSLALPEAQSFQGLTESSEQGTPSPLAFPIDHVPLG
jgi:hypothetical protein